MIVNMFVRVTITITKKISITTFLKIVMMLVRVIFLLSSNS